MVESFEIFVWLMGFEWVERLNGFENVKVGIASEVFF